MMSRDVITFDTRVLEDEEIMAIFQFWQRKHKKTLWFHMEDLVYLPDYVNTY